jgi:Phytanoyl-CoA dioxygenase (PhyH)
MDDDVRGFGVYHDVFTTLESRRLVIAVSEVKRSGAGARHVLRLPLVREVASDGRLLGIAARFVGGTPTPFRATLFDKASRFHRLVVWHQDTALPLRQRVDGGEWGPWSTRAGVLCAHAPAWALETVVALRVHLDDSVRTNGPLRVLPGSHRLGVLDDVEIAELVRKTTPVDCLAPAGGVVAMRPLTIHASSKVTVDRRRRVLHIEYAASPTLAPGIELALG